MSAKRKNVKFFALGLLAAVAVFIWLRILAQAPSKYFKTVFFDVGQGDAIFLETPTHRQILIDGGPSAKILAKLGEEMPFGDRYIDIVILTHPDADHISGLVDVLERYEAGLLIHPGVNRDIPEWQAISRTIEEKRMPVLIAGAGQKIDFGDGLSAEILSPSEPPPQGPVSDVNRYSVVSRFGFGLKSFLFAADAEQSEEKEIAGRYDLKSDVLKIGHHGSKNASSQSFLEAARPDFAVISVGRDNRYGHPHEEALGRLRQIGSQILRTDMLGDIKIFTDGRAIKID